MVGLVEESCYRISFKLSLESLCPCSISALKNKGQSSQKKKKKPWPSGQPNSIFSEWCACGPTLQLSGLTQPVCGSLRARGELLISQELCRGPSSHCCSSLTHSIKHSSEHTALIQMWQDEHVNGVASWTLSRDCL